MLIFFTEVIKFYWLMLLLYPGELYRLLGASSWMAFFNKTYTFLENSNKSTVPLLYFVINYTRLVIGTSRTVGSAKKFVRITSGFGGGEFTKTLRKVCTYQKLNLLFYCSNIAKSENAMLWRMLSRLETCIVYCCIWSLALAKSIVPRKT